MPTGEANFAPNAPLSDDFERLDRLSAGFPLVVFDLARQIAKALACVFSFASSWPVMRDCQQVLDRSSRILVLW
ncbi:MULTISPECIES: hypothetical protein [unclassified Bradyrhizobium]|uniref:hypothetical protein n=1 Tax=unclassified Bradyrhizobium TaxID=2631580 RepID=UPI002FF03D01